jgi:hypothetical protein
MKLAIAIPGRASVVVALVLGVASLLLRPDVFAKDEAGTASYIAGIESLEKGDYKAAVQGLTAALQADGDNEDYVRARGVAETLAEDLPAALADLQRAMRLTPADHETQLWLAAAYRMNADWQKGAMNFTHGGDVPADYADLVYNRMAMEYAQARHNHTYFDRQTHQSVQVSEPVKKLFPDAARAYAQRHKASGAAAAEALLARARESMRQHDWPAALRDLAIVRQASPDDPALRGDWAICLLGAGDALGARREFTHALSRVPLWADGYAGRAEAAAMIGESARASADLQTAAALGAKSIDAARTNVQKLLQQAPAGNAVEQFDQAVPHAGASSAASFDPLVTAALAARQQVNAQRRRYDEGYQERVRALGMAMREDVGNADRPEMLARFLYSNHVAPVKWNGPRSDPQQLRPQSKGERLAELDWGIALADAALKLDGRHVNAMATKALILFTLGRASQAMALANGGLEIDPQNVRLLDLKAQMLRNEAAALAGRAAGLRMGRTESHREQRADGEYVVTTHYPPTAQDLAEAQALEKQAAALRQEAGKLTAQSQRVQNEIIPALMKQGEAALAGGDAAAALKAFEQAYAYQPDSTELVQRLATVSQRLGDERSRQIFALLAEPMGDTNALATAELKTAWEQIVRRAWKSAGEALDRAAAIDPVDARIAAYRSVIDANSGGAGGANSPAAQQDRLAALALEEARARLMGTTFLPRSAGTAVAGTTDLLNLLGPEETGLTLLLRLQLGNGYLAAGQYEQAMQALGANVVLEDRFAKERRIELVPSAMLPDPTAEPNTIPDAPTLASLLAYSRLGEARALLALGRPGEAQKEFAAIRAYLANWPATAKDAQTLFAADAWARLGQAQAAYEAHDLDTAFKLLMSGEGWPWNLPADLEKQRKEQTDKVLSARRSASDQQLRAQERMTPREMQIQAMQERIRQLKQQRDAILRDANSADQPEQTRQVMKSSAAELDRMIAESEAALAKVTGAGTPPNSAQRNSVEGVPERRSR